MKGSHQLTVLGAGDKRHHHESLSLNKDLRKKYLCITYLPFTRKKDIVCWKKKKNRRLQPFLKTIQKQRTSFFWHSLYLYAFKDSANPANRDSAYEIRLLKFLLLINLKQRTSFFYYCQLFPLYKARSKKLTRGNSQFFKAERCRGCTTPITWFTIFNAQSAVCLLSWLCSSNQLVPSKLELSISCHERLQSS